MLRNLPHYSLNAVLLRGTGSIFGNTYCLKYVDRVGSWVSGSVRIVSGTTPSFAKTCSFRREIWGSATVWIEVFYVRQCPVVEVSCGDCGLVLADFLESSGCWEDEVIDV